MKGCKSSYGKDTNVTRLHSSRMRTYMSKLDGKHFHFVSFSINECNENLPKTLGRYQLKTNPSSVLKEFRLN